MERRQPSSTSVVRFLAGRGHPANGGVSPCDAHSPRKALQRGALEYSVNVSKVKNDAVNRNTLVTRRSGRSRRSVYTHQPQQHILDVAVRWNRTAAAGMNLPHSSVWQWNAVLPCPYGTRARPTWSVAGKQVNQGRAGGIQEAFRTIQICTPSHIVFGVRM